MSEEEIAEESHVVHPGSCPAPLLFGQCKEKCDVDGDCEEDEKCCRNLCGRTCTKIESGKLYKTTQCRVMVILTMISIGTLLFNVSLTIW